MIVIAYARTLLRLQNTEQFQCGDKVGKAVEKRPNENKGFSCNVR